MVKEQIAPRLRALGFKGSGGKYEYRSPEHWAMIGLQKSAYSDSSEVRFTMNVLVVRRDVWDATRVERPHLPKKPTANAFWGNWVWQHRIGGLLPDNRDLWWTVAAGLPTDSLADAVLWAVEDFVLPAMQEQIAASS